MVSMEMLHAFINFLLIYFLPLEPTLSEDDGSLVKANTVSKAVTR